MSSSAWAATELNGASSDLVLGRDAVVTILRDAAATLDPLTKSFFGARSAADSAPAEDEPYALIQALAPSRGDTDAATRQNPFAWTLLLIVFSGLTAVFAGKRSGGRGLIGA